MSCTFPPCLSFYLHIRLSVLHLSPLSVFLPANLSLFPPPFPYACLSACLSASLSSNFPLCLSFCLPICLSFRHLSPLPVFVPAYLSPFPPPIPFSLSFLLPICMSACQSVLLCEASFGPSFLSFCLSFRPPICLIFWPVCLFVCQWGLLPFFCSACFLSTYLSFCLSVFCLNCGEQSQKTNIFF